MSERELLNKMRKIARSCSKMQEFFLLKLRMVGKNGVVAYGAIMYIFMIFTGVFFGYSIGSSPIVGYHYDADNTSKLKNMFKEGLTLMAVLGIGMVILAEVLNVSLIKIFTGDDPELFRMASHGFRIYAAVFILPLFMGLDGVWFAIIAVELVSLLPSAFFLLHYRNRYHYL